MAKKGKTQLSLRATAGAAYLTSRGYEVPVSVVAEMLAKLGGYNSYAAYVASNSSESESQADLHTSAESSQADFQQMTATVRLIRDDFANKWVVIPSGFTDFYTAKCAADMVQAFRYNLDVLSDFDETRDLFVTLDEACKEPMTAALKQVFVVGPNFNRYGIPPLDWILDDKTIALDAVNTRKSVPADLSDFYDMGDDSGGFTVIEVAITPEAAKALEDFQRSTLRLTAQEIVGEIRYKARRHGFCPEQLEEIIRAEYEGKFLDIPAFFEQVRSV